MSLMNSRVEEAYAVLEKVDERKLFAVSKDFPYKLRLPSKDKLEYSAQYFNIEDDDGQIDNAYYFCCIIYTNDAQAVTIWVCIERKYDSANNAKEYVITSFSWDYVDVYEDGERKTVYPICRNTTRLYL